MNTNIIKSEQNDKFLKRIINSKSDDSFYTMIPYADCEIPGFGRNNIVLRIYDTRPYYEGDDTDYSHIYALINYDGAVIRQSPPIEGFGDDEDEDIICANENCDQIHALMYGEQGDPLDQLDFIKHVKKDDFRYVKLDLSEMFNNYESFMESTNCRSGLSDIYNKMYESFSSPPVFNKATMLNDFYHQGVHCYNRECECKNNDSYCDIHCYYECVFNDSKLTVIESGVLYIISDVKTRNIKNILYAPSYDLGEGDAGTYIYLLNGKHLLVQNGGDGNSVVFIKNENGGD
jgi:hypothetical protein